MDAEIEGKARKAKRVEVSIPATLTCAGGEAIQIELRDLSFYGFKAKCPVALAPGDFVKVDLPRIGPVRARVSWCKGTLFGGAFATAVDVRKCVSG